MKFTGKTALVTGAAAGIGRAVAIKLAQNGARLALVDTNLVKLQSVKEETAAYTNDVLIFSCDVRDEARVYAAVRETEAAFGRIDILVNQRRSLALLEAF